MIRTFDDRRDGGRQLAKRLAPLVAGENVAVVALRDDAIPVAYEVASELRAQLSRLVDDAARPRDAEVHRTVLLVDDGLAPRDAVISAVQKYRERGAERIIVAAPVSSPHDAALVRLAADDCACVVSHFPPHGAREWYVDSAEPTTAEVQRLLAANRRRVSGPASKAHDVRATVR